MRMSMIGGWIRVNRADRFRLSLLGPRYAPTRAVKFVVETTNFTDRVGAYLGPSSEKLKVTERFTRIDPQMIDYRIRVDDPVMYSAPFTIRYTITQQPNYNLYEYSCHEGNGAVGNALSGERAYDRAVAEAIKAGRPIPARAPIGMEVYGNAPLEGREAVREFGTGR